MADMYVYVHPITYEDCNVLGGRCLLNSQSEFQKAKDAQFHEFLGSLLLDEQEKCHKNNKLYPFERLAIFAILSSGEILVAFTESYDPEDKEYSYSTVPVEDGDVPDYTIIGNFIQFRSIQRYDILIQKDADTFEVVGYKTPKDTKKYGHSFDVFRCLDLRGVCKVLSTRKNKSFNNYIKYNLGNDFFVEAFDNKSTEKREFWLCRDFSLRKLLITCFDFDDTDYFGVLDENGDFIIDKQVAELLLELIDEHEYIFINNDHKLEVTGLKIED